MHDGSIDILAVYDVSRFARKIGVADILLDEVFECGVQLYLVSWDSVVRDTIRDRKVFYDESIYADIDRRKILERTTDGKREKFKVSGSSPVSPKTGRLILSGRDVPLKQQERRNGPGSITNG